MIVSASYRTDIPAFYGDWFLARLAAGWAEVRNPYSGALSRVGLARHEVDAFVFWTKNLLPFLPALERVASLGYPFSVSYSVLDYPHRIERAVPAAAQHVDALRAIASRYGGRVPVWRYDPVLITEATPTDWHVENFARLAASLEGATDEVVLSWAQIYAKTKRNLDVDCIPWRDPPDAEKRDLLASLAAIAAAHGMRFSVCAQPHLVPDGGHEARCVDTGRLSAIAGRAIVARDKGNRAGCRCAESRDIGAYDSCAHGCVYCYAVANPAKARTRFRNHDPSAPRL
jgi:hypothetical protein